MKRYYLATIIFLLNAVRIHANEYNILDYGAKADTSANSIFAIQKAIDKCSEHGGGGVQYGRKRNSILSLKDRCLRMGSS